MHIGFTGTKEGMTERQKIALFRLMETLILNDKEGITIHHGDCIGADSDFHTICWEVSEGYTSNMIYSVGHLPDKGRFRAFCAFDEERKARPYLKRNEDIVFESDILIACPKSLNEERRSGTWATIRYARKLNKPVIVVDP